MGLYSNVISHYSGAGSEFLGYFQTKDLESVFDDYWLSPAGELYLIDWSSAYELNPNHDDSYDIFNAFKWIRTDDRGRLKACSYTGCLRIYTVVNNVFIECNLCLLNGKIELVLEKKGLPTNDAAQQPKPAAIFSSQNRFKSDY